MTEDTVRYLFFLAMLMQDPTVDHYILENPYPASLLPNKELDLTYEDNTGIMNFEIKFSRQVRTSQTAHSDVAGSLINDLMRLRLLPSARNGKPTRNFFLYVTDDDMARYLSRTPQLNISYRRELRKFFCMPKSKSTTLSFPSTSPSTFRISATKSVSAQRIYVPNVILVASSSFACQNNSLCTPNLYVNLYELI